MKIAIYGISCSGKDTFITEFVKKLPKYNHVKGSSRLNEISQIKYGSSFRNIDSLKQNTIRKEFIKELENKDEIIVDGHYCFPEDKSYKITFTESDRDLYDIFFYLRAIPAVVKERISESDKNSKYSLLTEKEIEDWQLKEISELRDVCFKEHKEFIVLDENFEEDILFLTEYFSNFPNMNALEIANNIVETIITINSENKKVALFDCDRTIVQEDTTIPFFNLNNSSSKILKQIFLGDVYTVYQFWRQQKLYKSFSVYPDITGFNQNEEVVKKLNGLKEKGYYIYGLTAGIYKIWNEINEKNHLFDKVIGNNLAEDSYGIITDFVKGYTVELLLNKGYQVFSTGDSMCDIYMLEACGGYVWAPGKIRPIIQNYINEHKATLIKQYKNNVVKYIGIKEAE